MNRVVLDSNVWISAFITPQGNPARLAEALIKGQQTGITSEFIIREVYRGLSKRWFAERYFIGQEKVAAYISRIRERLVFVDPVEVPIPVRDPKDLPVLGTAIAGHASYLVTGDRDILEDTNLKGWMREQGIEVISPGEFPV